MPIEQRPDLITLIDGVDVVQTPIGPMPSSVVDEDAYEASIVQSGDGVESRGPWSQKHYYSDLLESVSWPEDGGGVTTMHPCDAAMLALAHLIKRMRWQSRDLRTIGGSDREAPAPATLTVHQLKKIFFDWPEWDGQEIPVANALITTSGDPSRWNEDNPTRSTYLLEGSKDVFGEGTMLRYLGEFTVSLRLIVWFAHKDIRRGFDARLAALLAAERSSEAWFRRVKVPEYFGAEVKLMLGESSRPDDSQQAQGNRWPLEYSMLGEVAHLELVRTPGSVSSFAIDSTVDGTT